MLINNGNHYSFFTDNFLSRALLFSSCPSVSPLPLCPSLGICLYVVLVHYPGTFGEAQMCLQSKILL